MCALGSSARPEAVGHAVPIAAVGGIFLLAGVRLPDGVVTAAEVLAGLALIAVSARVAWLALETARHNHYRHTHRQLSVGPIDLGVTHSHRGSGSFVVGILHGLADSGVAVGGLATGATLVEGVSQLGAFAVALIVTWASTPGIACSPALTAGCFRPSLAALPL